MRRAARLRNRPFSTPALNMRNSAEPESVPLSDRQRRALARTPAQCYRHGILQSVPFLLVIIPFGLLFGLVAAEAGMDIFQIMGFSVLVLAGASQFTAVQLISEHAPVILVIVSALAVNLRMAMYSAAMVPWLGGADGPTRAAIAYGLIDQTYAMSIMHYEKNPALSLKQRTSYFFGTATMMCVFWIISTWLGATVGNAIPDDLALDFAVPITFLAMVAPMLRSLPHVAAATVGVILSLAFAGLPSGLGVLLAAPFAMMAGAFLEAWLERRREVRA
ncbi:AzlC family ABC transporter permease [Paracoccus pacificus]|uniref:AzlC family ABC transporter permease n=1 Tax=Paracoccus pacificus TaxID=1463598 RepID=A0ABW4RAA5_9RHOB